MKIETNEAIPENRIFLIPEHQLQLAYQEMLGIVNPFDRFDPRKCAMIYNIGDKGEIK